MGVAVGVDDGVTVIVGAGVVVTVGVWVGSGDTVGVAALTEGGGRLGTAVAKPVGTSVGRGGSETAVSRPQPVNANNATSAPSQIVINFFIRPNCIKTTPNW